MADTFYAAAAVCRSASLLFGPYASDRLPYWELEDAQTVNLPEPEELARLLDGPRMVQPTLFEVAAA